VGLRTWLIDLLSRGEAPEPDPDEVIEVGTVLLSNGPLTIVALQEAGVEATMVEVFDAPTATTRARHPRCWPSRGRTGRSGRHM
jgi:hypothetical protein